MKKLTSRRIYDCMKGTRVRYLSGLFGMASLMFLFQTMIALMFLALFDTLVEGTFRDVIDNVLMTILVLMVIFLLIPFFIYITHKGIVITTGNIRRKAFKKLSKLPVGYFKKHHSAEITSKLTNDITELEKSYSDLLLNFIVNLISGLGTTVVMFFLDWRLSLIGVFTALLTLFVNTYYAKRLRQVSTKVQENLGLLNTKLSNIISGLQVVRLFNIQKLIMDKFRRSNTDVEEISIDRVKKQSFINALNTMIGMFSFTVITAIGAYFILVGLTTVGTIVAVIQLQNGLRELARSLGDFITNLQSSLAAGDRVFELFDEAEEPMHYPGVEIPVSDASLVIENVGFAYEDTTVLDKLCLSLNNNQTIALVGPSGGGKSTVFKLLMQFYPPKEGGMSVCGRSPSLTRLEEVRENIAYVPQDAYLFNCTVRENIAYGLDDASEQAIIDAAKVANAHDFIVNLPNGYDTLVGENGTTLSGGQRQRIAIARAVLKDTPILLLDEATSALDNESEKLVQEALERLMKNKATLVIAHRLSTIEGCDQILVIDEGRVVESGTHEGLLEEGGLYALLHERQSRRPIPVT